MSELVDAIRAKFSTPQQALRSMGLDDTLLDSESTRLRKRLDKLFDLISKQQASKKAVPRGRDQVTEPRHMPSDPRGGGGGQRGGWRSGQDNFGLPSGSPGLAEKRETMPPANTSTGEVRETLSGEDEFSPEEEQALREHAADMRKRGEDSTIIDHAMRMARDILRRRRSGRDELPSNRIGSREREMPNGGHFGGPRRSGEPPTGDEIGDPTNAIVDHHGLDRHAHDARLLDPSEREIRQIHKLLERFSEGEAGCCPDRDRLAHDAEPMSERAKAGMFRMFPDLRRIGSESEDGESIRDGTYRSRYEV
jgi:hypothetical protein